MRSLTDGQDAVEASGKTVREVVEDLESRFPGIKDRLCEDGSIRPDFSVVVGSDVSALGLLTKVDENSEVHFLPVLAGG